MAGATQEDLASLVVSLSADLTRYRKDMASVVEITSKAVKASEKAAVSANDNIGRSFTKSAETATRSIGRVRGESANMAAQFQDIAVQLQGGGSPFTVALQQGQQLGTVLSEVKQSGGSLFQGLAAAAGNFLNPVTAITVGLIAVGGYALQYFGSVISGAKQSDEDVRRHIDQLIALADVYRDQLSPAVADYLDRLKTAQTAEERSLQVAALQQKARQDLAASFGQLGSSFANAIDPMIMSPEALRTLEAVRQTIAAIAADLAAGRETADLGSVIDTAVESLKQLPDSGPVTDLIFQLKTMRQSVVGAQADMKAATAAKEDFAKAGKADMAAFRKALDELKTIGAPAISDLAKAMQTYDAAVKAAAGNTELLAQAQAQLQTTLGQIKTQAIAEQSKGATDLIKTFEGFTAKAKRDTDGVFRAGFGSDSFVDELGRVQKVTEDTVVSVDQATADLARRIPEFQAGIVKAIGPGIWDKLNEDQQAVLTSLAYNYGSLPKRIVAAIKAGGGDAAVAQAIADLGSDNAGINRKRRTTEAQKFGGDAFANARGMGDALQSQRDSIALSEEEIAIRRDTSLSVAEQTAAIAALKVETELLNEAKQKGLSNDPATLASIARITEATRSQTLAVEEQKQAQKDTDAATKQAAKNWQTFSSLASSFVTTFVNDLKQGKSAAEALRDALSNLADQLLQMALQGLWNSLGAGLGFVKAGATGGPVEALQGRRMVSPYAFLGAPRFAAGGLVGVRPGEIPAILHRGEVVIPAAMVRQAMRGSSSGSGGVVNHNSISITVSPQGVGDLKADTERGKQMGRTMLAMVQSELARQSRPGGMLTAQGSGSRVGR